MTIQHEALCDNLISPDSGALNLGERGEREVTSDWLLGEYPGCLRATSHHGDVINQITAPDHFIRTLSE